MSVDEPSAQLLSELRASTQTALSTRRPLLHHLNADSSWLLQIPRPVHAVKHGARFYYNILLDPWLRGAQTDLARWFSQQFHATPSAVQSIAQLEDLARGIEALAADLRVCARRKPGIDVEEELRKEKTLIDAVVVSHEFSDHCHKDTLLELHPDIPVFATHEAAKLIESWSHFRSVNAVVHFGAHGDGDWRSTSMPPLPEWIGISRLLQTDDVLNMHAALMIAFNNRPGNPAKTPNLSEHGTRKRAHAAVEDEDEDSAEAIIYTPHGIHSDDLALVPKASPAISTLAFLHGLHDVRVGTASGRTALQTNLGAHNGLKAQRILNSKYWIGTHDEVKIGNGFITWFLQRHELTLKDALERERKQRRKDAKDSAAQGEFGQVLDSFDETKWLDLRNGESRVLV